MNSYKEITNKYLKHNKKRTILTILGVILSVALITSVGLFIKSLQNSFIESTIKNTGSFHAKISKMTDDDYNKLKSNPKIDKVGVQEKLLESDLKDGKKIEINKYDKNAMEFLPKCYSAVSGRLPEKEGEIAIENWAFNYIQGNPKIGDTIKFKTDDGQVKEFKLTGVIQNLAETQYSGEALGMTYSNKFDIGKSTIYLSIYKKAGISNTTTELSKKFKGNCMLNKQLLNYSGEGSNELNKQLYGIAGVIIAIIVIATMAVIYNSFQISVIERMKQFGLLRAIGATPKQIRKIVLREASITSAVGIPLGLLSGIFAMFVVSKIFSIMSNTAFGNLKIIIAYYVLIISALVGVFSIYVSALIPARAAAKVSPLVAISSRTSISKEKISKKRGNILKRFLNIESLMAFKNIKRNRKKFRITVFSMIISITLFIFFSSFVGMMGNFTDSQSEDAKMNFELIGVVDKNGASSLKGNIINKVNQNNLVSKQYISYGTYSSNIVISNEKRNDYLVKNVPKTYSDVNFENMKMSSINTLFDIYDDDKIKSIKSYIKSGNIDISNMVKENGVIIVKNNMLTVNKGYYKGSITNLKVGDTLYVDKNMNYRPVVGEDYTDKNKKTNNELNKDDMVKVKVAAVVDDAPYQFNSDDIKLFHIIMSKDVMKNVTQKDMDKLPIKTTQIQLKDKRDADKFNNLIEAICDKSGVKTVDISKQAEAVRGDTLQLMVLMYGFIAVISLIGAVNIINTITTNLILRKKEIASLSAIGMTYKNIRRMILKEGVLYGLYGAFYGGIVGSLLSYVVSSPMRKLIDFKWSIPWKLIFISGLAAILIGLIAVISPLSKIKKENIIDVIRQED